MFAFDFKVLCASFAIVFAIVGFFPYFRDIFKRKTTPHLYTWLIWGITQSIAAAASWDGGGKFGAVCLVVETILVVLIFCLTFKYGTKHITRGDTIVLILALMAIAVWWHMSNHLVSVLMATSIDTMGYIPTIRKAFAEPWSETLSFWSFMALANAFIIASSAEYNALTVTYAAVLSIANITVVTVCIIRRGVLKD